jgi:hypothetical protein
LPLPKQGEHGFGPLLSVKAVIDSNLAISGLRCTFLVEVHSPIRKTVRVFLAAVSGLFSLPALIFGSYLFVCWIRIHTMDVFYVEYPYLLAVFVFGGIGLCR